MRTGQYFNRKSALIITACLVLIVLFIKLISFRAKWMEVYYSTSFYSLISKYLRLIFGWLPFSFGDILYTAAGVYLIIKIWWFIKILVRRNSSIRVLSIGAFQLFKAMAAVYLLFNMLWGLNYNRLGIAYQLHLTPGAVNTNELIEITSLLVQKVNSSRRAIDSNIIYPSPGEIYSMSASAYRCAEKDNPFLRYENLSVKKSLYGRAGNYLGFLGYYNPFTGEAQLNLTQPKFLLPYVTCHEIAHQLGYASEEEANFAGYLAAVNSRDTLFHYSVYFDLFNYANRELYSRDSVRARANYVLLDTLVKKDIIELKNFYKRYKNPFAPIIHIFYDQFLKANQQAKGINSYNYVVSLLVAYYKKYGKI